MEEEYDEDDEDGDEDDDDNDDDQKDYSYKEISGLRLVKDIQKKEPGEWWLLKKAGGIRTHWYIVKYHGDNQCKIYNWPDGGSAYYSEPGVWYNELWDTDRKLEEDGESPYESGEDE
jgi:hypothetical protein